MDVKSLLVKFGTDTKAMEAGFKKADGFVEKHAAKFKKAGRTMTVAGGAILGIMTGVVKLYGDFDNKLNESIAIMGDVSDTMKNKMAEAAKEMSEKCTSSATQLAGSFFFLASAGLDAEQSIAALPVVAAFAQAGAFDLAQATDLLTDAQSALGLSSKDVVKNQENMVKISDVLVMANTLANASVSQFSEALTNKAGPAMRAYDIEVEEGVAVLAAFADQGIKGKLAGEKYSIVLRDLQKATLGNKTAFERAGIAVYDANGDLNNMGDIVAQLEKRLGTMSAEQKKSELGMLGFQEESQSAILTLMGTSKKIKEYEKNLKSAGGTTKEVADKQLKSLTNQLILAKNSIVNAAISLGEQLAPMVVEIAGKIKETVGKIKDWIKEHPALTKGIALTAAKAGVLLMVLGPILIMLPGLIAGIKLLGTTSFAASVGIGKLGIAAIITMGAYKGLIALREKWEKSKGKYTEEETKRWATLGKEIGGWTGFVEKAAGGLRKMGGEATIQGEKVKDLNDIWHLYGENTKETLKAIAEGKHGEDLKTLLGEIGGGHLKAAESAKEQGKSLEDLKKDAEDFMKSLEDNLELPSELAEEFGTVTELLETEVHPALRKIGGITEQAVLVAMTGIGFLKEDLMNLSTIFPEELEPSAIDTVEVLKKAVTELQVRIFETTEETKRHWTKTFDDIATCAYAFIGGLDTAFAQAYENQMIRIDNEEKRTLDAIDTKYDATIDANKKIVEAEEEKTEKMMELAEAETKDIMDGIDLKYRKRKEEIENTVGDEEEKAALLEALEAQYQTEVDAMQKERAATEETLRTDREAAEDETATALEEIEFAKNEAIRIASEDLETKRADARRTAAKQEKAVALMSAIVNTAAGVVKALSSTIPPFNIILAAITAAAGAVQIALISAQPIPLAEGGIVTRPTTALIGERGPEAVIPLNKLQPALAGGGLVYNQAVYFYGDINNAGDLDEISRRLAEKTRRAIERGRS